MVRLVSKLLILFAVLLMPLGMAPSGAAAQQAQSTTMSTPMRHCPDRAPQHDKAGFADCAMACAAALPAIGKAIADSPKVVCAPLQPTAPRLLLGFHPETATPPPKRP